MLGLAGRDPSDWDQLLGGGAGADVVRSRVGAGGWLVGMGATVAAGRIGAVSLDDVI